MDSVFWLERWQQGQIGFHQDEYNPYLIESWGQLAISAPSSVFVPLSGKSLDMLWLRSQGYQVIGVEVAEQACQAFFIENKLCFEHSQAQGFSIYQGDGITLYCGDFFHLTADMLEGVSAVYDRAAMVAMPGELRLKYIQHLRSIIPKQAAIFLVTMEYDQQEMDGPPFAVPAQEVSSSYDDAYHVTALLTQNVLDANQRFRERGVSELYETVYTIEPR